MAGHPSLSARAAMSCQRRLTAGSRSSCSSSGNLAVSTVIVLMPRAPWHRHAPLDQRCALLERHGEGVVEWCLGAEPVGKSPRISPEPIGRLVRISRTVILMQLPRRKGLVRQCTIHFVWCARCEAFPNFLEHDLLALPGWVFPAPDGRRPRPPLARGKPRPRPRLSRAG